MAELALRTSEFRNQKEKYLALRPVGSVIVALSARQIRLKWLEICCDLVSPTKRDTYKTIPGWEKLCDAWTPELRDTWWNFDKPDATYPLGWLMQEPTAPQQLWQTLIEPLHVVPDLPLDPTGHKSVSDTWLWSEHERKNYFIVVNTDAPDAETEMWAAHIAWDADTGEILPPLAEGEVRDPKIKIVVSPRKVVKYATDIGLSAGTLTDIADPNKVLDPRYDHPVAKAKFIETDVTSLSVS